MADHLRRRADRSLPARAPSWRRSKATSIAARSRSSSAPSTAQFKGEAQFVERDDVAHHARLKAKGRDTGGRGNAEADIVATAEALSPTSTKCTVTADLHITGKVAQFGRGIMGDVSKKLIDQFASNLNRMLDDQGSAPVTRGTGRRAPRPTRRLPPRALRLPPMLRRHADGGNGAPPLPPSPARPFARSTVPPPSRSISPASPGRP